jgi:glyoxylase-like metal-dependent hydrolase (beta-lactamase superfamily II)
MLQRDVAPGVHRIHDAKVNWYLVEDGDAVTVVDAGVPRSWGSLRSALREIGRGLDDVAAVVATHAHYDHLGFAERARRELDVPVWLHERDVSLSRHPWLFERERSILYYGLRHPASNLVMAGLILGGAALVKGLGEARAFSDEEVLDVPGSLRPVFTPGHTHGHTSFHLPDRDAVIAGDAIVTFNPYTTGSGPQIVAGAATADSRTALASLGAIAATEARILLTGHGEPWTDGVESAVEIARAAGPS